MVDLNENQVAWLRDEVGDTPSTDELNVMFERIGAVRDVAIAVWRRRRTNMLKSPLSTSLSGVASVNYAENVKALERRIAALERLDADPSDTPGEDTDGGTVDDGLVVTRLYRTRGR